MCGAPGTARESRPSAGGAFHPRAHRSYLELIAAPGAVPYARRCIRQTLAASKLGGIADDVELVISELVTNAGRATLSMQAAAPVALYLALERGRLYALAWDCCPDLPVLRAHATDAESGRGLELVSALSDEWGACAEQRGGKVTWARFELRGIEHERPDAQCMAVAAARAHDLLAEDHQPLTMTPGAVRALLARTQRRLQELADAVEPVSPIEDPDRVCDKNVGRFGSWLVRGKF